MKLSTEEPHKRPPANPSHLASSSDVFLAEMGDVGIVNSLPFLQGHTVSPEKDIPKTFSATKNQRRCIEH